MALTACGNGDKSGTDSTASAPDLTQPLSDGEVRAGVVTDQRSLFGGISAEGGIGDIKIYNSRAQFIIQAPGNSSYYVGYGGSVIDADMVRGDDEIGQDLIDDGSLMVGLGRMFEAERVTVINDGTDGSAAVVRARGGVAPLTILTGTLEAEGLIQPREVDVTIDYTLEADSSLLRIESTVVWKGEQTPVQLSDMIFYSGEAADRYQDGVGRRGDAPDSYEWTAAIGDHNEGALAILQGRDSGAFEANTILEMIGDFGPLLVGANPTLYLEEGDTAEWTRYWGVGPDIATILDDWHRVRGTATESFNGTVNSGGEPVAGARVHLLDSEGQPTSLAITDASGAYAAQAPAKSVATVIAESRGPAVYFDLAAGAGWYGPYAADSVRTATLDSLAAGAVSPPNSPGYGFSEALSAGSDVNLELQAPGTLNVSVEDGGPAVVRVDFAGADPVVDNPAIAHRRPNGAAAWAYVVDGEMSVPLEPGEYSVVVHRGTTHEAVTASVTIESGDATTVRADLIQSVDTAGLRSIDPHSHATPSGDGKVPMEGRLIVTAAHGVDIHVGTDHDHVADYRVLLEPLGLDTHLGSIVANEVSPILRGHHNAYPLETVPDEPNGGAFQWWTSWREWVTTAGFHEWTRRMRSDGEIIVQANHPTGSSGLFGNAGYDPIAGTIANRNSWSSDFDAVEVLNDGGYARVFPYYLDLLNRGLNPTPVGVSDSHDHLEGMGVNRTWVPMALERIEDLTNNHVRTAILNGGTVASFGPLVVPTVDGEWAAGKTYTGSADVTVDVRTPSWMSVDELQVYENGIQVQTLPIEGGPVSVTLDPSIDAVYVLTVTGSDDMAPAYPGKRPWALVQGIFIDVDGDGWESPLPSLDSL